MTKKTLWGWIRPALFSDQFQNALLKVLEKQAVKFALKKFAVVGGIKAWLITFIVEQLIEEGDEHLIEPAFRALGYRGDVLEGARIYKKVKNAKDVDEWVDSLNDV